MQDSPFEDSASRLASALDALEARLDRLAPALAGARTHAVEADALMNDRARLAAQLDAAKARERELESAAEQASAALSAAIADVRAALGEI